MLAVLIEVAEIDDGTLRGAMAANAVMNRLLGRPRRRQPEPVPEPACQVVVLQLPKLTEPAAMLGHNNGPPLE
jgi:hypothetical protein